MTEKPAFINTTKSYAYDEKSPDDILDSSPEMEILSPGTVDDVASLDDKSSIAEATSGSPSPVKVSKTTPRLKRKDSPVLVADNTHLIVAEKIAKWRQQQEELENPNKRKENEDGEEEVEEVRKKSKQKLLLCTA